jgi:hypothetical protein
MTPTVEMKPLSRRRRQLIFGVTIVLFIVAVPVSVFYAIGYRFDFSDKFQSIKSVGGMYVRNDTANTEMFINGEPVVDMRVFQKAAYIQNLAAGMHRIHVQGDTVQTWVKELPVHAHFVTEVSSFNLPKVPQIRIITEFRNLQQGTDIIFNKATSTKFAFASTTNNLEYSSTTATSSYTINTEYTYIKSLFASSTEAALAAEKKATTPKPFTFNLSTTSAQAIATSTKMWRNFRLFQRESDVVMKWEGNSEHVPYYYCLNYESAEATTLQYGLHIYDALLASVASSSDLQKHQGERLCRSEIRIDNLGKEVLWFDYYPDSTDLVLMHLEDGLYVVEVDDRAWQNTQLLYPGDDIEVLQDGGRIYIHDGEYYLEVFTEIASQT